MDKLKIMRSREVIETLRISRSSFHDKQNRKSPRFDPTFPAKIRLGLNSVGYFTHEIEAWAESRKDKAANSY